MGIARSTKMWVPSRESGSSTMTGGTPGMAEDLDRVVTFGKALSHVVRVELLFRYGGEEPASPSDVASATGIGILSTVNYHTLQLVEYGALELAKKEPARGGFENFYRRTKFGTELLLFATAIGNGPAKDD